MKNYPVSERRHLLSRAFSKRSKLFSENFSGEEFSLDSESEKDPIMNGVKNILSYHNINKIPRSIGDLINEGIEDERFNGIVYDEQLSLKKSKFRHDFDINLYNDIPKIFPKVVEDSLYDFLMRSLPFLKEKRIIDAMRGIYSSTPGIIKKRAKMGLDNNGNKLWRGFSRKSTPLEKYRSGLSDKDNMMMINSNTNKVHKPSLEFANDVTVLQIEKVEKSGNPTKNLVIIPTEVITQAQRENNHVFPELPYMRSGLREKPYKVKRKLIKIRHEVKRNARKNAEINTSIVRRRSNTGKSKTNYQETRHAIMAAKSDDELTVVKHCNKFFLLDYLSSGDSYSDGEQSVSASRQHPNFNRKDTFDLSKLFHHEQRSEMNPVNRTRTYEPRKRYHVIPLKAEHESAQSNNINLISNLSSEGAYAYGQHYQGVSYADAEYEITPRVRKRVKVRKRKSRSGRDLSCTQTIAEFEESFTEDDNSLTYYDYRDYSAQEVSPKNTRGHRYNDRSIDAGMRRSFNETNNDSALYDNLRKHSSGTFQPKHEVNQYKLHINGHEVASSTISSSEDNSITSNGDSEIEPNLD